MYNYIFLFFVTIAEATIGVFVKLVGDTIPIFTLNFYRAFFAFIFIAAVIPFVDKTFKTLRARDMKTVGIMGAFIALQITVFNIAMTLAPIANVVIFWSVAPFFVFIFSVLFLKEKVHIEHVLIFLIALIGIIIANPLNGGEYMLGNMIALADGALYAASVSYMRHAGKTHSPGVIFWAMLAASIYMLPALYVFGPGELGALTTFAPLNAQVPAFVWAICLGVFSTGVAYFFITLVLRKINASVYSLIDIIVSPIIAAFFGFLVFTEIPSHNMIYGGAILVLSGFWLTHTMSNESKLYHSDTVRRLIAAYQRTFKPKGSESDIRIEKSIK